jgi:hypothetical protein
MTNAQKKMAGVAVVVVVGILGIAHVRARNAAYEISQRNKCKNNLRMIDDSRDQAALERNYKERATVTEKEISPFLKGGFSGLVCPKGGRYTIGPVGKESVCSEHGTLSAANAIPMPAVNAKVQRAADARSAAMEDAAIREAMRTDKVMAAQSAASQAKRAADAEAERLEKEKQAKPPAEATAAPSVAQVEAPPAAPVEAPAPTVQYKLNGIMGGNGDYVALINNQIRKTGERLGTARIVRIEATAVTIETADGTTVKVNRGSSVSL